MDVHAQLRGESACLADPVAHDGHRHNQQRRPGAEPLSRGADDSPLSQQQREELDGLAETHVVGQAGAEPDLVEEREPRQALELIGPQRTDETLGRIDHLERLRAIQPAEDR
jgi:hypothetical protein